MPKSSTATRTPSANEGAQQPPGPGAEVPERDLAELDAEQTWVEGGLADHGRQVIDDVGLQGLGQGEVHREPERGPLDVGGVPRRHAGTGHLHHVAADGDDGPRALGQLEEHLCLDHLAVGAPPGQGLDPGHLPVDEPDDGQVVDLHLAGGDGLGEVVHQVAGDGLRLREARHRTTPSATATDPPGRAGAMRPLRIASVTAPRRS